MSRVDPPARLPLFAVKAVVCCEGSPYTASERILALAIADFMNAGGECFPSLRTLAAWSGLSVNGVRKLLRNRLRQLFEIQPGGARAGDRYASATYKLREGYTTGAPHEGRASPGEREGYTTGARGVHPVAQNYLPNVLSEGAKVLDAPPPAERRVAAVQASKTHNGNGAAKETWLSPYLSAWRERFGGAPNAGMLAKFLRPVHEAQGEEETSRRFRNYLRATDARYVSVAKFAETHGAYAASSNGAGHVANDKMQRSAEVLRRFVRGGER